MARNAMRATLITKEPRLIYLGTPGKLVSIKCPATQNVDRSEKYSFTTTLEGRKVGQVKAETRRTWTLQTSEATTPSEQAALLAFYEGEWGIGPYVFVSADAAVTNLLTPSASTCREVTGEGVRQGGPTLLAEATIAGNSLERSTAGDIFFTAESMPVLSGTPVCASAWVLGVDPYMAINWYDANGTYISTTESAPVTSGHIERATVVGMPPEGAATCRPAARNALKATRPALTWTAEAFEWSVGEGCHRAVITSFSKEVVLASAHRDGGRYGRISFQITEVG